MVKDGLKNETLTKELLDKGSSVITTRNDFGVHIFSGSLDDGVVSGKLGRPKYNIDELQKTINTNITELLPVSRPAPPRTVPFEVYNDALTDIAERDAIIERLNVTSSNLQARIADLETENQSLDIEIDGARTLRSIAENQTQIANNRVSSTIEQLQFSIQKATQEAIQRASLEARNQVLLSENGTLRELLYGKSAQVQAGAKSSGKLLTVNANPKTLPAEAPIRGSQSWRRSTTLSVRAGGVLIQTVNRDIQFPNGENLTFFNPLIDKPVTVTLSKQGESGWYSISPLTFTLQPNTTRVLEVQGNTNWTTDRDNKSYTGILEIRVKADGENDEVLPIETLIRRFKKD